MRKVNKLTKSEKIYRDYNLDELDIPHILRSYNYDRHFHYVGCSFPAYVSDIIISETGCSRYIARKIVNDYNLA